MVSFRESVQETIRRSTCALMGVGDATKDFLAAAASIVPGVNIESNRFYGRPGRIGRLVCPGAGPAGTVNPPVYPSPEGNCVGVEYDVVVRCEAINYDGSNGGAGQVYQFDAISAPNPRIGPIGPLVLPGRRIGGLPSRNYPPISILTGENQTPSPLRTNSRFDGLNLNDGDNQVVREISRTITRLDGQPDDCPPPGGGPVLPVVQPSVDVDITYEDNGVDITVPVTLVYLQPQINLTGELNFPIQINGPNFNFGANFNVNTDDILVGPGGPGGDDPGCCFPEEEEGEQGEEPDGERRLIRVEVIAVPPANGGTLTEILNSDGPNFYLPDLGHIIFEVKTGDRTSFLNPIKVQLAKTLVPVPANQYAVGYSFVPRVGVETTFRPIYATIPLVEEQD